MNKTTRIIFIAFLASQLTACVSNDISDLEAQVSEIMKRPGGEIEPLPEIKPYDAYTYQSLEAGAPDPFAPFYIEALKEVAQDEDAGLTEEMEREIKNRNREELEGYELDSLKMVGTLDGLEDNWGIIESPDGTVHRVKVGNYMGQNIGKITNIFEDKI
ncbi:MAG: pilus assembly protein PilP, partial [Thiotrichales bacterium]|nr:pilus assembly protein PilP [Thiotrichales bacterium]